MSPRAPTVSDFVPTPARGIIAIVPSVMTAWSIDQSDPDRPLRREDRPVPEPGPDELLVRVLTCGVCRTDLHLVEGDLPMRRPGVIPGHEVVGEVVSAGPDATPISGKVGIAWLRRTDGVCGYCARGDENLCPASEYTGWDADGGYAEYAVVPSAFAYPLPVGYADLELAPLLCAGIIGYRALRTSGLSRGGRLGVYGFGASAHLATQVALAEGATVHVLTRSPAARELALSLGVASVGGATDRPPEPLDAAILFAPAGDLVPLGLEALDRGGTLAVAGIYLSDIPQLDYQRHLFQERHLRSVTANARRDGEELLAFAGRHHLQVTVSPYPLSHADRALADLAAGRVQGAAVLQVG